MTQLDEAPPVDLADARDKAAAIAADEPPTKPKRTRTRKPRATKPRAPKADTPPRSTSPRPPALRKRLEDSITTLGALLLLVNPTDGQLVIAGAAKQAAALDAIAKDNPAVRRALERMLTASVYGQLAAAFAPTLLGIAANHRMLPAPINGLVAMATAPAAPAPSPDASATDGPTPLDLGAMLNTFGPMFAAMTTPPAGGDEDGGAGVPRGSVVGVG